MHVYCLFCEVKKCTSTATLLEKCGYEHAVSPKIVMRERIKGNNVDVMRDLLPGYVFVYRNDRIENYNQLKLCAHAIRILGDPKKGFELQGTDYEFAMSLFNNNGVINTVRLIRIGNQAVISEGFFRDCKGIITKLDQRKQRARIDFVFNGLSCHTWIAFEMVQTIGKEN